MSLEKQEERDQRIQWWCQQRRDAGKQFMKKMFTRLQYPLLPEENTEERNDVCLYKTLRYPPACTPPTIDS